MDLCNAKIVYVHAKYAFYCVCEGIRKFITLTLIANKLIFPYYYIGLG